jgi:uncharacterized protein (UPF0333 family)
MKGAKAQVAFEYMLVVIVALAFMLPVWVYITSVKTETSNELMLSYAKNAVDKIASTADLVYSQGSPARVQVSVYIPDGVESYEIINYTINMVLQYGNTYTDVFAVSRARMNGTLPTAEGNYWMKIEAVDNEDYDIFIQAV